jgi:hypothetical protein
MERFTFIVVPVVFAVVDGGRRAGAVKHAAQPTRGWMFSMGKAWLRAHGAVSATVGGRAIYNAYNSGLCLAPADG